jgi:hypothetical protein
MTLVYDPATGGYTDDVTGETIGAPVTSSPDSGTQYPSSTPPQTTTTPAGTAQPASGTNTILPSGLMEFLAQQAQIKAQQTYYDTRLKMLEIPQFQAMTEIQRQQLAMQQAQQAYTQEMGLATLMSNPANLTSALSMMGLGQEEIGKLLSGSPLVQSLLGKIGAEGGNVNATPTPIGSAPQALTGANAASLTGVAGSTRQAPWAGGATVGTNPDFNFIQGRQLPMMGMAQAVKTNSPVLGLLGGLAEYSGQDAKNFFGDYQAALPQGQRSPLTRTI